MDNVLKNYILSVLLNKDEEVFNNNKYPEVIRALDTNYRVDEICSYIMRSLEAKLIREKISLTDTNILKVLTTSYCVDRAHEYLKFLENDHELAHPCEYGYTR